MTEYIESLPAAGVAPVARGHWERDRIIAPTAA